MENKKDALRIHPVPRGAVLQADYSLRVRNVGAEDWQELKVYRVDRKSVV